MTRGIAQLVRLGWLSQVHVKSEEAQRTCMLLVNRQQLLTKALDIENSVRGSLSRFSACGSVSWPGEGSRRGYWNSLRTIPFCFVVTEPMLRVRQALLEEFERLDRLCQQLARRDPVCRRLMTVPGVGVVVALTYRTGVDAPERFSKSRDVGAHFGLTPKRYSSGQTDYDGRISRCGDEMVRTAFVSGSERSAASWPMVIAPVPGPCGSRREAA